MMTRGRNTGLEARGGAEIAGLAGVGEASVQRHHLVTGACLCRYQTPRLPPNKAPFQEKTSSLGAPQHFNPTAEMRRLGPKPSLRLSSSLESKPMFKLSLLRLSPKHVSPNPWA